MRRGRARPALDDLTDEQLTAIVRGRLTLFVTASPADGDRDDSLTDAELQAIIEDASCKTVERHLW